MTPAETPTLGDYNRRFFEEHSTEVEEVLGNYWLNWGGWIGTHRSGRLVGHWLAYPVRPVMEGRPYLGVIAGARGDGSYQPGANFDLRPRHPETVLHVGDILTDDGHHRLFQEFTRAKGRLRVLVGHILEGHRVPAMEPIVTVYVDADGRLLSNDESMH